MPGVRLRASCLVAIAASVAGAAGSRVQAPAADTTTAAVLDAAAGYVKEYEKQLTSIIADEIYTQRIDAQIPRDFRMPRWRSLDSELFFIFAPADYGWMAIRDVIAVDGKPVADRPNLEEALRTLPAPEVATTFKSYNSRFNLGRVVRNFNEPTLSLLVLDGYHRGRFTFERKDVQRNADPNLVTVSFIESLAPTLIFDLNKKPVYSTGDLIVEMGTGRVRTAVLRASIGAVRVELTTVYAPDERLGMWVPSVFLERYEDGLAPADAKLQGASSRYEDIVCEAKYTNFRRFAVSVRIK
jgi:hypothetical protein